MRLCLGLTVAGVLMLAACSSQARADGDPPAARKPNRLAGERSPYLRQHADNPVDWYPWGEEAFERARREKKVVFLSVGYSACHWCHVMEHESFEDAEVARFLNEHFVSVKVDREERPDVDDVYMLACQAMTGSGGWPLTVLMTPDRRPFFAGTYFPKKVFLDLLGQVRETWAANPKEIEEAADHVVKHLEHVAAAETGADTKSAGAAPAASDLVEAAAKLLAKRFDADQGGFVGAPKFPPHHALRLLVRMRSRVGEETFKLATVTLDRMAAGGIQDHVGGGFHRYSVDAQWRVPHFEKMLYDNAMLGRVYAEAFAATGDERYREVAVGVFDFMLRELRDEAGGFHSALDADSEGEEGRFYTWTPAELEAALGKEDAALVAEAYGVTKEGNFEGGRSLLYRAKSSAQSEEARLAAARAKLLEARARRVRPALDDKVLTAWNGLAIGALARGGAVLGEPRYVDAAARAAAFILERMRRDGRLLASYRAGDAGIVAYLDDHAFLVDGLMDLYEADPQDERKGRWLGAAREVADLLLKHHHDGRAGGFFFTAHDGERLLLRRKEPYDGAIPAGNGVAVRALARLGAVIHETGLTRSPTERAYFAGARGTLDAFAGAISRAPHACVTLIEGAAELERAIGRPEIATPGTSAPDGAKPLARASRAPIAVEVFLAGERPLRAGEKRALEVRVTIAAPFHVNAPEPLDPTLTPLALSVRAPEGVSAGEPRYPAATLAVLGFLDEPLRVYRGRFEVEVPLEARAAGPATLALTLSYQACDDTRCLEPAKLALDVPLTVAP